MSEKNDFKERASIFAAATAKKAKGLAVYAATKTKQLSRVAKLNVDIASQKDTIKSAYAEIGRLYYEAHKDAPEGFYLQLCQEIDTAQEAIDAMEAEIAQLKEEAAKKAQQASQPAQDADFESVVDEAEADIQVEIVADEDVPDVEEKIFRDTMSQDVYPMTVMGQAEPATEEDLPKKAAAPFKKAEPVPPSTDEEKIFRDTMPQDVYPMTVMGQTEAEAAAQAEPDQEAPEAEPAEEDPAEE
jgi:hypothetical protein